MSRAGAVLPRGPLAPLVATALLLALACPPFHLLAPSFLALAPLGVWLGRLPAGARGARDALRGGFVTGLLFYSLLLHWMVAALVPYTPLGVVAFAAAVLLLSALLAAAVAGMHRAVHRLGWPVWLALPVFWTAMEWVRAHAGDLSFPWMQLGDTLTGWPRLIGAADVVGSRGLSFWLALVAGLVAEALLRRRPGPLERWLPGAGGPAGGRPGGAVQGPGTLRAAGPPPRRRRGPGRRGRAGGRPSAGPAWRPAAAALLAASMPVAYSLHRWSRLEPAPAARVAVFQPDVPQELKLDPASAADSARASVARLAEREIGGRDGPLDVAVLPETTLPVVVPPPRAGDGGAEAGSEPWLTELAGRLGAPVLYGALGEEPGPAGERGRRFNAAFLRGRDGRRIGRYAKRRLVPAVEATPFVDAAWARRRLSGLLGPRFGGLSPGADAPLLAAGEAAFGVLICFESAFSGLSRGYRARGADFLVNITNDAWFGRESPTWARTSGLWQHPAHLVMRAVETRAGIVRAANTGISGIVDPLGRTRERTELFEPAAFAATVETTDGPTPYVRWGDVAGVGSVVVAAGALLAAAARRRRRPPG